MNTDSLAVGSICRLQFQETRYINRDESTWKSKRCCWDSGVVPIGSVDVLWAMLFTFEV